MQNKDKVTIVVPVYNVEKYINRCIDSLINQSHKNIEILLVNDGSKDNSIAIAEEKVKTDNRIKIITQENQGLSGARNTGIKNATGEYICFIDSDDFIHKDYVKILLENLLKNKADICCCDFYYIDEKNNMWNRKKQNNKFEYTNIEAIKDIIIGNQETEVMAWNKLYKTSLFKEYNVFYPIGKLHEDNFTTYKLYYYSKKISVVPERLYYYLQRSDSIMGKIFNKKRLDALEAVEETKCFLKKKNIDLTLEIECYEMIIKIGILNHMIRDNFWGREREKIINEIKKSKKNYFKNKYADKKIKFALLFLGKKEKIYIIFIKLTDKIRNLKKILR